MDAGRGMRMNFKCNEDGAGDGFFLPTYYLHYR